MQNDGICIQNDGICIIILNTDGIDVQHAHKISIIYDVI